MPTPANPHWCEYIVAVLIPPMEVGYAQGCGCHLILSILLSTLFWFPGMIHALFVMHLPRNIVPSSLTQTRVVNVVSPVEQQQQPAFNSPPYAKQQQQQPLLTYDPRHHAMAMQQQQQYYKNPEQPAVVMPQQYQNQVLYANAK